MLNDKEIAIRLGRDLRRSGASPVEAAETISDAFPILHSLPRQIAFAEAFKNRRTAPEACHD